MTINKNFDFVSFLKNNQIINRNRQVLQWIVGPTFFLRAYLRTSIIDLRLESIYTNHIDLGIANLFHSKSYSMSVRCSKGLVKQILTLSIYF